MQGIDYPAPIMELCHLSERRLLWYWVLYVIRDARVSVSPTATGPRFNRGSVM